MDTMTLSKHIYFRLSPDEYEEIEKLAKKEDRPMSWVIRRAVRAFLRGELDEAAQQADVSERLSVLLDAPDEVLNLARSAIPLATEGKRPAIAALALLADRAAQDEPVADTLAALLPVLTAVDQSQPRRKPRRKEKVRSFPS